MRASCLVPPLLSLILLPTCIASTPLTVTLSLSSRTTPIEADKAAVYYPPDGTSPSEFLFLGNDGSAATGGFRAWTLSVNATSSDMVEAGRFFTRRTKLVNILYDLDGSGTDWALTLSQVDSKFRFFQLPEVTYVSGSAPAGAPTDDKVLLGDWSSLCPWRSPDTGNTYLYVFGKREVQVVMVRGRKSAAAPEVVEVTQFKVPVEAAACAVTEQGTVYFGGGTGGVVYAFAARDSVEAPKVKQVGTAEDDVVGLVVYHGRNELLLVGTEEKIDIFSLDCTSDGTQGLDAHLATLRKPENVDSLKDFTILQAPVPGSDFVDGLLWYGAEGENAQGDDEEFFGLSPLAGLRSVGVGGDSGTAWNPRSHVCDSSSALCGKSRTNKKTQNRCCRPDTCPRLRNCSNNGFCPSSFKHRACACFSGSTGPTCAKPQCPNNCSGAAHGKCVAPSTCVCVPPWTGPACATLAVPAKFETETVGGEDGDDPAVWIHPDPQRRGESRILGTLKSKVGEGIGVWDLHGNAVGWGEAREPNNVDVAYGITVEESDGEKVDVAVAACRGDDTICMFLISPTDGALTPLPPQPLPEGFIPYGSCVYHSQQPPSYHPYVLINSKTGKYLQYLLQLQRPANSTTIQHVLTLVRTFTIGDGTSQPEACVVDDENALLFAGEEAAGIWVFPAEPTNTTAPYLLDSVASPQPGSAIAADIEGIALVHGPTRATGYLIVSAQGTSTYLVYDRAYPHTYRFAFSIPESRGVDEVTNTDGVAAVGAALGEEWPLGVVVVHDDVNEVPGGEGADEGGASFKIVSGEEVWGNAVWQGVEGANWRENIDTSWDPRAAPGRS
ncbi:hypothetical protein BDZ91DRAFT_802402 [Kalaharituber pfeilii]|nr:hypothetical protein BDZ91DRAFT_802402 [Kalaharituber pfeilii]